MKKSSTLAAIAAAALGFGIAVSDDAEAGFKMSKEERAAFRAAMASGNPDLMNAFLQRYPDSALSERVFDEIVDVTGAPPEQFPNLESLQSAAIY